MLFRSHHGVLFLSRSFCLLIRLLRHCVFCSLFLILFLVELLFHLEIKSGKDYKKHSALENVLKDKNYEIEKAYIFSEGNVETKGQKIYMPIYMIMFLKNTELKNTIYKIDLSGL